MGGGGGAVLAADDDHRVSIDRGHGHDFAADHIGIPNGQEPAIGHGERRISDGHGLCQQVERFVNGAGLDVFIDQAVQQPGFYQLSAVGSDTTVVAINQDKHESQLVYKNISALKSEWKGDNIRWPDMSLAGNIKNSATGDFPLWKICVLLAIVMLSIETWLLARVQKPVVG